MHKKSKSTAYNYESHFRTYNIISNKQSKLNLTNMISFTNNMNSNNTSLKDIKKQIPLHRSNNFSMNINIDLVNNNFSTKTLTRTTTNNTNIINNNTNIFYNTNKSNSNKSCKSNILSHAIAYTKNTKINKINRQLKEGILNKTSFSSFHNPNDITDSNLQSAPSSYKPSQQSKYSFVRNKFINLSPDISPRNNNSNNSGIVNGVNLLSSAIINMEQFKQILTKNKINPEEISLKNKLKQYCTDGNKNYTNLLNFILKTKTKGAYFEKDMNHKRIEVKSMNRSSPLLNNCSVVMGGDYIENM